MLSLGYELLTRRSELIALRTGDLKERDDGTLRVLIRRSKSDPFGEGRIAFTSQETASLVREWITWRGPEIDWLFCPIYHCKPIDRSLETTTVKRLIKTLPAAPASIRKRSTLLAVTPCELARRRTCSSAASTRPPSCGQEVGNQSTSSRAILSRQSPMSGVESSPQSNAV